MAECASLEGDTSIVAENLPPPAFTSSLRPKNDLEGGFTCSFLDPPKELRTQCPICLYILRDPYQATCCGCIFCHMCIERVKTYKKPCPACRNTDFNVFPDRGLRNALYGFKVRCTHKDRGCTWSGELGKFDSHLNLNRKAEQRFFGCEFEEETCCLCALLFPRGELEAHEMKRCQRRPHTCEYCNDYSSTFEDVAQKHWLKCPLRPVPCTNDCGIYPLRKDLDHHLKNDCELREEEAPIGVPSLEEIQSIVERTVKTQLTSVGSDLLKTMVQDELKKEMGVIGELRAEAEELRIESQRLRLELEQLKSQVSENATSMSNLYAHLSIVPVTFTIDNYQNRLVLGDMGWTSPFFYTSMRGYKMCLLVDVGGDGQARGIYVSVFLNFTKGDYDSQLKWPFRGAVTVEMLNQRNVKGVYSEVIKYHEKTPNATAGRMWEEGKMSKPWGKGRFIRHDGLSEGGFILNNTLKFKISKVVMEE